ncbi:MAG: hypothetical protein CMH83_19825 [Nocardioides sp.]|nr:hypothetical protein [Nocardioides sp.]
MQPTAAARLGPAVLAGCLAGCLALTGCGDERAGVAPTDGTPGTTTSATAVTESIALQVRPVEVTSTVGAPDSQALQDLTALDCDESLETEPDPDAPLAACDDAGVKYLLGPAEVVGGVASAQAQEDAAGGWGVAIELDDEQAAELEVLTEALVAGADAVALVVDGRVLSAPVVQEPLRDGEVLLSGDYDEAEAAALAERLGG